MPELPDISAYITALESRIVGESIEHVRLASPFLLRTENHLSPVLKDARSASCGASASAS
jgi:formamidopyrimidine-DNA glycosylase